jgi:hypothetical protein
MKLNYKYLTFKISFVADLLARWQSWSIASDLKSDESLRIPWVRIPLSPLIVKLYKKECFSALKYSENFL